MNDRLLVEELAKKFGANKADTGAAEVQIAILTHDIERLKKHFLENPKDLHSSRGFIAKIEKRKKLLSYLKRTNFLRYQDLIKALGIRK